MPFYRGYNTVGVTFGSTRLEDKELIKRDLLNHFHIRKGEKLMNPEFGTIVWNHLFDPLTEETRQILVDDVTRIVNHDPRTDVGNIILSEYEHGIQIEVELIYRELDQSEELLFKFNGNSSTVEVAAI